MSLARIKERFFRLSKYTKFVGIGSALLLLSVFMPWYADLDAYKIGDEFLGVTGPASFVGIAVLLLSALSLWIFSGKILERHAPRLPVREGIIHIFVAAQSLFLLLLVNSIYFHPKFGVNITLKETRFGMTLAFIGAILTFIGGYLQNRDEIAAVEGEGKLEPLIKLEPKLEPTPRPVSPPQAPIERPHAAIRHSPPPSQPTRPLYSPGREIPKGFVFGDKPKAGAPMPQKVPIPQKKEEDDKSGSGSYMIRMDL